jgi:hypothetical protein
MIGLASFQISIEVRAEKLLLTECFTILDIFVNIDLRNEAS